VHTVSQKQPCRQQQQQQLEHWLLQHVPDSMPLLLPCADMGASRRRHCCCRNGCRALAALLGSQHRTQGSAVGRWVCQNPGWRCDQNQSALIHCSSRWCPDFIILNGGRPSHPIIACIRSKHMLLTSARLLTSLPACPPACVLVCLPACLPAYLYARRWRSPLTV
jgi:hypothetical protein